MNKPRVLDRLQFLYALDCGACIYCGKTRSLHNRIVNHYLGTGAAVTAVYKPIELLYWCEIAVNSFDEAADDELMFACTIASLFPDRPVSMGGTCRMPRISFSEFNCITKCEPGALKTIIDEFENAQGSDRYKTYRIGQHNEHSWSVDRAATPDKWEFGCPVLRFGNHKLHDGWTKPAIPDWIAKQYEKKN